METLFKPDPELVFFIFYKKYLYLQVVCALSILRLYAHRARLDVLALFSLLLSFYRANISFWPFDSGNLRRTTGRIRKITQ
jgi:hypothetical protein